MLVRSGLRERRTPTWSVDRGAEPAAAAVNVGAERFPERGCSDADASEDATPRAEAATVGLIMLSLRPRSILDLRGRAEG